MSKMYQLFKRVNFQVSGDEALNQSIIMPLVEEFQKRLNNFKFEEGSFKAWIEIADDLQIYFNEPTIADASFRISVEMRDEEYDGSSSRFNQFEISVLANRLKELEFEQNDLALRII